MTKPRFQPPTDTAAEYEPFASAEEAWIWSVQSLQARLAGARMKPGLATVPRPCEASDVVNCAHALHRRRRLSDTEMGVLMLYGKHAAPPVVFGEKHRTAQPVWRDALRVLEEVLEQKGIIVGRIRETGHAA